MAKLPVTYKSDPVATSNPNLFLKIHFTLTSQGKTTGGNISSPTITAYSVVDVKIVAYKSKSTTVATTGSGSASIVIDGSTTNITLNNVTIKGGGTECVVWKKSCTIYHEANGKKTLSATLKTFKLNVSNPSCKLKSALAFEKELPSIQTYANDTNFAAVSSTGNFIETGSNYILINFNQASNVVRHNVKFEIGTINAWWSNVDSHSPSSVVSIYREDIQKPKRTLKILLPTGNFTDGRGNTWNLLSQFTSNMSRTMKVTMTAYGSVTDANKHNGNSLGDAHTVSITIKMAANSFLPKFTTSVTTALTKVYNNAAAWSIINTSSANGPIYSPQHSTSPTQISGTNGNDVPVISSKTSFTTNVSAKPSGSYDNSKISSLVIKYGSTNIKTASNTSSNLALSISNYTGSNVTSSGKLTAVATNLRGQSKTVDLFNTSHFYTYSTARINISNPKIVTENSVKKLSININAVWSPAFRKNSSTNKFTDPINKICALLYYKMPGDTTFTEFQSTNLFESVASSTTGNHTITCKIPTVKNGETKYGEYEFKVIYHDSFTPGSKTMPFKFNNQDENEYETNADSEATPQVTTGTRPRYINMDDRRLGLGGRAGFDSAAKKNSITVRWDTYFRKPIHLLSSAAGTGTGSALVLDTTNSVIKVQSSAKKYKKNINYNLDINKYHDEFTNIKPAEYEYKTHDGKQLGFIADDINEINSDFIIKNAAGEVENYKDRDIIALLCLEVKRQNAIIDKLLEETGVSIDDLFPESNVVDVEPLDE
jgi:hypothetical protein